MKISILIFNFNIWEILYPNKFQLCAKVYIFYLLFSSCTVTKQETRELEKAKIHFIHLKHTNPILKEGSTARKRVEQAGVHLAEEAAIFKR